MDFKYMLFEKRHFRAINAIRAVTNDFALTGSAALSLLGIIRRPIHDIDIVITDRRFFNKFKETFGGTFYENYQPLTEADVESISPNHLRFDLADISVCVFFAQPGETTTEVIMNDGQRFVVSDPKWIYSVKVNYALNCASQPITEESQKRLQKNLKDISDYLFYIEKRNNNGKNI